MNQTEKKQLAKKMEDRIRDVLVGMTAVLHEQGFEGFEVVSFSVGEPSDGEPSLLTAMADRTPCPVRCEVLPDGRVECRPRC